MQGQNEKKVEKQNVSNCCSYSNPIPISFWENPSRLQDWNAQRFWGIRKHLQYTNFNIFIRSCWWNFYTTSHLWIQKIIFVRTCLQLFPRNSFTAIAFCPYIIGETQYPHNHHECTSSNKKEQIIFSLQIRNVGSIYYVGCIQIKHGSYLEPR